MICSRLSTCKTAHPLPFSTRSKRCREQVIDSTKSLSRRGLGISRQTMPMFLTACVPCSSKAKSIFGKSRADSFLLPSHQPRTPRCSFSQLHRLTQSETTDMILYHATPTRNLDSIQRDGLDTMRSTRKIKGVWLHTASKNPSAILHKCLIIC